MKEENTTSNECDALEAECRRLEERIASAQSAGKSLLSFGAQCLETGERAYRNGRSALTVSVLSKLADCDVPLPRFYFLLALAEYDEQNMDAARHAIAKAAQLAPGDADIAFALAQISFENWRPSARLFRDAQRLAPENLEVTKNAAAALYAEKNNDAAIKLLSRATNANPDWIDGQQELAKYQLLLGNRDGFDAGFKKACSMHPRNLALRLAWFRVLAQEHKWERARAVICDGETILGSARAFDIAHAFIASESGQDEEARQCFDTLSGVHDPSFDLCRVRFFLRNGDADRAMTIAERHVGLESAGSFWPYLSIAWRVAKDKRADWLDCSGAFIRAYDLAIDHERLSNLAETLRNLHLSKSPYLEQSVRGGTQTDRNLFFNGAPIIQDIRQTITHAVEEYIGALPPPEAKHPLLALRRDRVRFDGCWSIRLHSQGFHVSHVHPAGWISSALYVSLPDEASLGEQPAGWISFGEAPPELGIELPAYKQIKPEPGRLVLFPSTMWHRTIPFNDGERLTIAFDVSASN